LGGSLEDHHQPNKTDNTVKRTRGAMEMNLWGEWTKGSQETPRKGNLRGRSHRGGNRNKCEMMVPYIKDVGGGGQKKRWNTARRSGHSHDSGKGKKVCLRSFQSWGGCNFQGHNDNRFKLQEWLFKGNKVELITASQLWDKVRAGGQQLEIRSIQGGMGKVRLGRGV